MNVNARHSLQDSVTEQEQIRYAARQAMGQQLVGQGSSGFQTGTGSALDALRESAQARELDLALSRRRGVLASQGFKQQGALAYAQGKAARAAGIISGAVTIAEQVAGGFGGAAAAGGAEAGAAAGGGEFMMGGGSDAFFAANPFGGG